MTSQQPTLRWELAEGGDGARIELCRDRALTHGCESVDADGNHGRWPTPLAPGVWFWRLQSRAGEALGASSNVVWQFTVGARSAPVDTSWGSAPDVNGDGYADLLVGAPAAHNDEGRVAVYLGGAGGLAAAPSVELAPPAAESAMARFGDHVVSAGDVNGDGFGDVVVCAPEAANRTGRAFLFLGSAHGLGATPAIELAPLPTDGDGPAFDSVAGVGDVNGDGYGDLVAGAMYAHDHAGTVHVYLGGPTGLAATPTADLLPGPTQNEAGFGVVASAGDINGDGFGDVAVGDGFEVSLDPMGSVAAPTTVRVYFGSAAGLATAPAFGLTAPETEGAYVNFGNSLANAGDVNGDGYADLVVGAPGLANHPGHAYLYLGGAGGPSTTPAGVFAPPSTAPLTGFVGAVASAGDVDGDGYGDIILGAAYATANDGRAYLYRGSASGPPTSVALILASPAADGPDLSFGSVVVGAGDLDGDGLGDVALGVPMASQYFGRVLVYRGGPAGPVPIPVLELTPPAGDGATAVFGASLARAHPRPRPPATPAAPPRA